MAVVITKNSVQAEKLKNELGIKDNVHAIGFTIPNGEEEEEYYEDE